MEQTLGLRPVRIPRASDGVVQQIKALILGRRLAPGDQLPSEKALQEQFGLSRITIRDALRILESQGLVEIRVGARGGAFVARPSTERVADSLTTLLRLQQITVHELIEARLVVEPQVASLAAKRAGAKEMDAMARAIAGARAGREAGDDRFMPHSVAFHLALAEASKNQVLLSTVSSIRAPFHEALAALPAEDMARRAIDDHQQILNAIRNRDGVRAERVMHEHIAYFARRVRRARGRREA